MKFVPTSLPDVIIVEPQKFGDDRGFFMETYHRDKFAEAGITSLFVQDNFSRSILGTLRGLHFQEPHAQGKLIRVLRGRVFDVAVDIRKGSPDFGKWVSVELSEQNERQLWVPPGFAHGFCALTDIADFSYKCTGLYAPMDEQTICWDDPEIGIDWPVTDPIISEKDAGALMLCDQQALPAYSQSN